MALKKVVRVSGDVREHPRYSIEDAARYLKIPLSTVNAWCRGQSYTLSSSGQHRTFDPVLTPADSKRNLLSFYNLVEAHVLRATRERQVPLKSVRSAIQYLRQAFPNTKYPLLSYDFLTSGQEIFIDHLGQTINASACGQQAMREILEQYLRRIERDENKMPVQIQPLYSNVIVINASLSSGKPVVKGTRVMASVLADRRKAGESIAEMADDFKIPPHKIEQVIAEYAAS